MSRTTNAADHGIHPSIRDELADELARNLGSDEAVANLEAIEEYQSTVRWFLGLSPDGTVARFYDRPIRSVNGYALDGERIVFSTGEREGSAVTMQGVAEVVACLEWAWVHPRWRWVTP